MQVHEWIRTEQTRKALPVKLDGDCQIETMGVKTLVLVITTNKHRIEIEIGNGQDEEVE